MPLMFRSVLAVAAIATITSSPARAADPIYLSQGWSNDERQAYYYLPQGSELMPYRWFLALEQQLYDKPFREDAYIQSFRFIPNAAGKSNPDGLPVGFAKGPRKDGHEWLGLTCAACHTGQFTYQGKVVRVDGGTTLADILGFQSALVAALQTTLDRPVKFDRFARKVLGKNHTPEAVATLTEKVREHLRVMTDWEATSRPAHPTGFGVWDALNILLNSITALATGAPDNYRVPNAPVSFPSIWLTNQYDRLLWNASVESSILRQIGEVIIVFGKASARVENGKPQFSSSADIKALNRVYHYISDLKPPQWPEEVLGKIDREAAKRGEAIYQREKCATCHSLAPYPTVEATPGGRKLIKVVATPLKEIGTDPVYAEYFVKRTATPASVAALLVGTPFENQQNVPAAIVFLAALTKITEADLDRAAATPEERKAYLGDRPLPKLPQTPAQVEQLLKNIQAYKATPLAGVWATAPYLHNGSVSSLYELLLPPEKRAKVFTLGSTEFDPKKVGYQTAQFSGGYRYDTRLNGFSNRGHTYGTAISEAERLDLVEFLKTL